jgi:CD36 family
MPTDSPIVTVNVAFAGVQANLRQTETSRLQLYFVYGTMPEREKLFASKTVNEMLLGYADDKLSFLHQLNPSVPADFPGILNNMTSRTKAYPPDVVWTGKDTQKNFRQYFKWRGQEIFKVCTKFTGKCTTEEMVPVWQTAKDSRVTGSDGSQLYPGVNQGGEFRLWSENAYRAMRYVNRPQDGQSDTVSFKGLDCLRFTEDPREYENVTLNPANAPYFQFGPNGFLNLTRAASHEKVYSSRPHGKGVSSSAFDRVDIEYTVEPGPDSAILIEPYTGATVDVRAKSQINFYIDPIPHMPLPNSDPVTFNVTWFENLQRTYIPCAWFAVEASISDDGADELKKDLFFIDFSSKSVFVGGLTFGCISAIMSVFLMWHGGHYRRVFKRAIRNSSTTAGVHEQSKLLKSSEPVDISYGAAPVSPNTTAV